MHTFIVHADLPDGLTVDDLENTIAHAIAALTIQRFKQPGNVMTTLVAIDSAMSVAQVKDPLEVSPTAVAVR